MLVFNMPDELHGAQPMDTHPNESGV